MFVTQEAEYGLWNSEIYARIVSIGGYYDFALLSWSPTETANCRTFLTEIPGPSQLVSGYYTTITPPAGGPYSIEIVRLSTGQVIGNALTEVAEIPTPSPSRTGVAAGTSLHNVNLRYDKGLGNVAVYARIPYAGLFWNFTTFRWQATETVVCDYYLAEFADTSTVQSWYYGSLPVPNGGPYPIEIWSNGQMVGNDILKTESLVGQGTVKVATIIAAVGRQLQDILNIGYPTQILLAYLNLACHEIVDARPEANSILQVCQLVAGTRQSYPAGWNALLNANRNMGVDGATPGKAITSVSRETMDQCVPDWHTWPEDGVASIVVIDEKDPYAYGVFPPQPTDTPTQIENLGSAYPVAAQDPVNDPFPLPDEYEIPAIDYCIYRCLAENTTVPNALQKAQMFQQKFYQDLSIQKQVKTAVAAAGQ